MYSLTNRLLGKNQEPSLPNIDCDTELSNKFAEFFVGKIQSIRTLLQDANQASDMESDVLRADVRFSGQPLTDFTAASCEEVRKLLMSSPSKSCELDPIPTFLLKQCIDSFVPAITTIVNKSLCEAVVPSDFKQAIVRPLLKKPGLDKEVFKNYRPVSNLPFVSKIVEKVVAERIEHHLDSNFLHGNLQSAYRSFHSTETALLRVHHDIATALDNNCCAVLVMLDLSAAFDVIDHHILFRRLENTYGIAGSALSWIKSYLSDRSQRVAVGSILSDAKKLTIGVPQGSVLGPKLYCMFSKPIGEICRLHNMRYHIYADDTQVYIGVEPLDNWENISYRLKNCLSDIRDWMSINLLKLNQDKTVLMVFAPKHRVKDISDVSITFGESIIHDAPFVKNLGAYFDKTLCMEKQCDAVTRSCYFNIRNIGRIRPYISEDACKTLANSLVTSRFDYSNALLYGINKQQTNKLQRAQNATARLYIRHITPVLMSLHWLPVEFRSQYKLLLYVYKALNDLAPLYLKELVTPYKPARSLRSESAFLLQVPKTRTKTYGERRFDKAAATLWNALPSNLRLAKSVDIFKHGLKTHLYRQAFNT